MAMIDPKNNTNVFKQPSNIVLEDRKKLTISGVSDVDSFDEQTVILFTELGELTVKGAELHINRLSLETGEVSVEGKIAALIYQDQQQKGGGFMGKLFR